MKKIPKLQSLLLLLFFFARVKPAIGRLKFAIRWPCRGSLCRGMGSNMSTERKWGGIQNNLPPAGV